MKRILFCIMAAVVVLTTACEKDDMIGQKQMIITTENFGRVVLLMAGSGTMTIDWGDGTEIETHTLSAFDGYWYASVPPFGYPPFYSKGKDKYLYYNDYSATSVRTITITGENITHLGLGEKWDWRHQLTKLNVSRNVALTYLKCCVTQLKDLDVSRNVALTYLECGGNQLTNLDVSRNVALNYLECESNQLTNLDVSKNTVLEWLSCSRNQLSSLDMTNNTALKMLVCDNNQLSSLDVSKNAELKFLSCGSNQLTNLDVSKNTELESLYCSMNKLMNLDVGGTASLRILNIFSNQLSTNALNNIFGMLNSNNIDDYKTINITDNPGTDDCNRSIAEKKGWIVRDKNDS